MTFRKNVMTRERVVRAVGGAALIVCGIFGVGGPIGIALLVTGVIVALTGASGFCPARAALKPNSARE